MNPPSPPLEPLPSQSNPPFSETSDSLSEKNFIQNGWTIGSFPFWLWIALLAALSAISWGTLSWYHRTIAQDQASEPFLRVTNRQFSLFLWQFPAFLPKNHQKRMGYLPAFSREGERMDPILADAYVSAPPALLFLYHTFSRLLAPEELNGVTPTLQEFKEFLHMLPEWQPSYWKEAPPHYMNWIGQLDDLSSSTPFSFPPEGLPREVQQAFIGWKSYFKEGKEINALRPTVGQVKTFLAQHPTYNRSYWRNIGEIEGQHIAGNEYLRALISQVPDDEEMPPEQLSSFLRFALFHTHSLTPTSH